MPMPCGSGASRMRIRAGRVRRASSCISTTSSSSTSPVLFPCARRRGERRRKQARSGVVVEAGRLPEALLFDCDGVLVDTERDGHRVAFNQTFAEELGEGAHTWDVDLYGELVKIGGGKERMYKYFSDNVGEEPFASVTAEEARKEMLQRFHLRKTDIFMAMVETGELPLRPGVKTLISSAIDAGVKVAVCSTSNERAVSAIVRVMLGDDIAAKMPVFAGDMVPRKKPDPAIYLMAAEKLGVSPENCVVVEDSHIGLSAAKAAGMRCIVTTSPYTQDEDFGAADAVFPCIGDGSETNFKLEPDLTFPGPIFVEEKEKVV